MGYGASKMVLVWYLEEFIMDAITILRLMMSGQTPEQNKGYGISQSIDASDGGKVYNYYDADGNSVTDPDKLKAYGKYGGTNPYKPITGLNAAFNPEAANYVSRQNNAGFQSDIDRNIQRHIIAENLGTLPKDLYADPSAPLAANITLNAGGTTAPQLGDARQALEMIRAKVPQARATEAGITAQAGTERALNDIQETQSARPRIPITAEYLNTRAENELHKTQDEKRRLNLESILGDTQLSTANINAMIADKLADNRLNLMGALRGTDTNRILAEHYQSGILPPSSYPFGTSITPEGNFRPGTVDPNFVSPMRMKMAGFGTDSGQGIGPVIDKGSSGRIALPVSNPKEFGSDRQPINNKTGALPSTGTTVSASAPKGTNINNVSIGTHLTSRPTSTLGMSNIDKLKAAIQANPDAYKSPSLPTEKDLTKLLGKPSPLTAKKGFHWEFIDKSGQWEQIKD